MYACRQLLGRRSWVAAAAASATAAGSYTHCSSNSREYLSPNFIADAVDMASPSVVNVLGQASIKGMLGTMQGASSGSGFIISSDGFVATNAHVVANSTDGRVVITMWNGKRRQGVVHSADPITDIALVKISDVAPNEALPVAAIGSSAKLRPGEFVVALGSPLLLQNSVTFGIVSSTARPGTELGMRQSRLEYIQTDASINIGNSGGPLCNLDGAVVGINTMKAQGTDGISFAIPMDTAWQVITQLRRNKKVVRPYIGINMVNYNPSQGRQKNRSDTLLSAEDVQVRVVAVERGSPAEAAGIRGGDILLECDGRPLRGVQSLLSAIGVEVNKKMDIKVSRNGDIFTAHLTTGSPASAGL